MSASGIAHTGKRAGSAGLKRLGEEENSDGACSKGMPTLPIEIDMARERYPFCVVWTPIPVLSWFLPFIGHVGVCDSLGRIHDFEGTRHIGVETMLFGDPVKYWDLSPRLFPYMFTSEARLGEPPSPELENRFMTDVARYDLALRGTTTHFRACEPYNFVTNNCHSYVARVLEMAGYGQGEWSMASVCFMIALRGRYVSWGRLFITHFPFLLLLAVFVAVGLGVGL